MPIKLYRLLKSCQSLARPLQSNMIVVSALVLFGTLCQLTYGQQCDANGYKRFDGTSAQLMTLGGSGRLFPENKKEQLKKYCDESNNFLKEMDKYKNKCMKTYAKQTTGVLIHGVRKVVNKYCKKDSKALTELIEAAPCPNRAKRVWDQCYTTLIDNFQGAYNTKDTMRIPHICCEYYRLFQCVAEKSLNKDPKCTEANIEIMSNWVREIFQPVVDLICGDYIESSDKCDKLGRPPKKKKSQRRTKSFLVPLVDALASLPEA